MADYVIKSENWRSGGVKRKDHWSIVVRLLHGLEKDGIGRVDLEAPTQETKGMKRGQVTLEVSSL